MLFRANPKWKVQQQLIEKQAELYKGVGEKVIAVAKRKLPKEFCGTGRDEYQFNVEDFERWFELDKSGKERPKTGYFPMTGYTFLGMVTTWDPPKNSAKKAIKLLQMQQKKIIVITGDNAQNTKSCMKQINFIEDLKTIKDPQK